MKHFLVFLILLSVACNQTHSGLTTLTIGKDIYSVPKGWGVKLNGDRKSALMKGFIISQDTAIMQFYQNTQFTGILNTPRISILRSDTLADRICYMTENEHYWKSIIVEQLLDNSDDKFFLFIGTERSRFKANELTEFYETLIKK